MEDELAKLMSQARGEKAETEALGRQVTRLAQEAERGELPALPPASEIGPGQVAAPESATDVSGTDSSQVGTVAETDCLAQPDTPGDAITLARTVGTQLTLFRNRVRAGEERFRQTLARMQVLQELMRVRTDILLKLTDYSVQLNQALTTIGFYLGQDEIIEQLREGAPASAGTLLTIRQRVLFMDEESLIAAEEGGLDFTHLEQFDEWLLSNPAHLTQILPEPLGIVALKPRRTKKDYGLGEGQEAQLLSEKYNQRNFSTYLLIRNGEQLFRYSSGFVVGERLFPARGELDKFFVEEKFNWETRRYDSKVLTVKDGFAYENAVKRCQAAERHYRNTLVMIQGLVDRSGVFPQLEGVGVNLLRPET